MKTVIDAVLPRDFLTILGIYVQLCAHIEKMAWLTLAALQGIDWKSDDETAAMVSLRKKTQNLLKSLKSEAASSPLPIRERLVSVIARIEGGMEERHMAVHGAWSRGSQPNTFKVDYYTNTSGDHRKPVWGSYYFTDFTVEQLAETVRGADYILQELVTIHDKLRSQE